MKTWREDLEHAILFTKTYRMFEKEHPAIREAMCLRVQYPYALDPIQANDLLADRYRRNWVRFTPHDCDELAFTFDEQRMLGAYEDPDPSESEKENIMELIQFWKAENTQTKVRAAYPSYMAEALPSDNWVGEAGIAFPLYRICGAVPNFAKLLNDGIPDMKSRVESYRQQALRNGGNDELFAGMLLVLDLLSDTCLYYAEQALTMSLSGYASSQRFTEIAPYIDLFLFDYKESDEKRHRDSTGV